MNDMTEYLQVVEVIPYRTFKEKMNITKDYDGKAKIEVLKDVVYIERIEKGA